MSALAGLLNHQTTPQSMVGSSIPMASSTSGTSGSASTNSSSSSDSATISANDFLTLLVTEMQNQDPTADTDPNEYIDQLVQVNSLEQLIDINQTLTTGLGTSSPTTGTTGSPQVENAATPPATPSAANKSAFAQTHTASQAGKLPAVAQAPGNLSVPATNTAAQRVAHSLSARTSAHPAVSTPAIP